MHIAGQNNNTLEDSTGEESNTLEDTTTTVMACFGDTSNLCSRFSHQPQGLRLRGGAKDVNRNCIDVMRASDDYADVQPKLASECMSRVKSPNSGLAQELSSDCA